ncbi:MAG: LON peptidase substrate-binding domain-containing protein [Bacteroidota bacterium]
MTDFLPLFPLKLVVFPDEKLNLHIFEPRYKQLIRECEQNGITFGIPAFIDGEVMDTGTEIKLLAIEKRYPNGSLDIKTQGIGTFRIHEFYREAPNKLYAGADIERIEEFSEGDSYLYNQILLLLKELFRILKIDKKIPKNPDDFSTFEVAHHVGLSFEQEYQFLCLNNEVERQEFIADHLQQLIPVVKEMERLRKRVQLNGHFKNIDPPNF